MTETELQGGVAPAQAAAPVQPVVPAQPEPVIPVAPVAPVFTPAPVEPLPTEVRDRTREQFEKLLDSNRRLMEQNEVLRRQTEQPIVSQVPRQQVNPNDFVERDPITGEAFINEQRLKSRIEELQQKASHAEQTIQSYIKTAEDREIERQEKETYFAHPELNPKSKDFDQNFNKQVRAILTDSFYASDEYGGRPFSFKEAADYVRQQYPKPSAQPTAEQQAEAQAKATAAQAAKEQASAQPASQPRAQVQQNEADEEELANLRYRTRYMNDDAALAQRIMHTEHILPRDAEEVS